MINKHTINEAIDTLKSLKVGKISSHSAHKLDDVIGFLDEVKSATVGDLYLPDLSPQLHPCFTIAPERDVKQFRIRLKAREALEVMAEHRTIVHSHGSNVVIVESMSPFDEKRWRK